MISFGCFKKYAHICTDIHSRYLQSNRIIFKRLRLQQSVSRSQELVYLLHQFSYFGKVSDRFQWRKTGRPLSVTLTPEAMILVKKYMNRDPSSPYLFPLLKSREGTKEAYREYQLALRSFNQQLMLLGELLGLSDKLSSYTARHTWATTAYYCEIHPGIISEAMGHSSITVTETYLNK